MAVRSREVFGERQDEGGWELGLGRVAWMRALELDVEVVRASLLLEDVTERALRGLGELELHIVDGRGSLGMLAGGIVLAAAGDAVHDDRERPLEALRFSEEALACLLVFDLDEDRR